MAQSVCSDLQIKLDLFSTLLYCCGEQTEMADTVAVSGFERDFKRGYPKFLKHKKALMADLQVALMYYS